MYPGDVIAFEGRMYAAAFLHQEASAVKKQSNTLNVLSSASSATAAAAAASASSGDRHIYLGWVECSYQLDIATAEFDSALSLPRDIDLAEDGVTPTWDISPEIDTLRTGPPTVHSRPVQYTINRSDQRLNATRSPANVRV